MTVTEMQEKFTKLNYPDEYGLNSREITDLLIHHGIGPMTEGLFYLIGDIFDLGFFKGQKYEKRKRV